MLAEPSADGDSKETEIVPVFLLTNTFRRSFAARIASQSLGALAPFSPPNSRSVQPNFIFPVAGSNFAGRTIGHRLYFLNTRTVRSLLLKRVSRSSTLVGLPISTPNEARIPKAGFGLLSSIA